MYSSPISVLPSTIPIRFACAPYIRRASPASGARVLTLRRRWITKCRRLRSWRSPSISNSFLHLPFDWANTSSGSPLEVFLLLNCEWWTIFYDKGWDFPRTDRDVVNDVNSHPLTQPPKFVVFLPYNIYSAPSQSLSKTLTNNSWIFMCLSLDNKESEWYLVFSTQGVWVLTLKNAKC